MRYITVRALLFQGSAQILPISGVVYILYMCCNIYIYYMCCNVYIYIICVLWYNKYTDTGIYNVLK